jgi:hypothetical protein
VTDSWLYLGASSARLGLAVSDRLAARFPRVGGMAAKRCFHGIASVPGTRSGAVALGRGPAV